MSYIEYGPSLFAGVWNVVKSRDAVATVADNYSCSCLLSHGSEPLVDLST